MYASIKRCKIDSNEYINLINVGSKTENLDEPKVFKWLRNKVLTKCDEQNKLTNSATRATIEKNILEKPQLKIKADTDPNKVLDQIDHIFLQNATKTTKNLLTHIILYRGISTTTLNNITANKQHDNRNKTYIEKTKLPTSSIFSFCRAGAKTDVKNDWLLLPTANNVKSMPYVDIAKQKLYYNDTNATTRPKNMNNEHSHHETHQNKEFDSLTKNNTIYNRNITKSSKHIYTNKSGQNTSSVTQRSQHVRGLECKSDQSKPTLDLYCEFYASIEVREIQYTRKRSVIFSKENVVFLI